MAEEETNCAGLYVIERRGGACVITAESLLLKKVKIEACVIDHIAQIGLWNEYFNHSKYGSNFVYLFPKKLNMAMISCSVLIDGKEMKTEIVPNQSFHSSCFAEQFQDTLNVIPIMYNDDMYTVHVGQLPPSKFIRMKISYVETLQHWNGVIRLIIPTTILPKLQLNTRTLGCDPTTFFCFNATVHSDSPIFSLVCASHKMYQQPVAGSSYVRRISSGGPLVFNRDIVLSISSKLKFQPQVMIEVNERIAHACIAWHPRVAGCENDPSNNVFIINHYEGMCYSELQVLKSSVGINIRNLLKGSKFNIILYGRNYKNLFSENSSISTETLEEADHFLEETFVEPGSNLLEPLKFLFKPSSRSSNRQIKMPSGNVFIIMKPENKVDLILSNQTIGEYKESHCFNIIEIGLPTTHSMFLKKAREAWGRWAIVSQVNKVPSQLGLQVQAAMIAALEDIQVELEWGKGKNIPDMVAVRSGSSYSTSNKPALIFAEWRPEMTLQRLNSPDKLTIKGKIKGQIVHQEAVLTPQNFRGNWEKSPFPKLILRLFGLNHITMIENERLRNHSRKLDEELFDSSTRYNIVSSCTDRVLVGANIQQNQIEISRDEMHPGVPIVTPVKYILQKRDTGILAEKFRKIHLIASAQGPDGSFIPNEKIDKIISQKVDQIMQRCNLEEIEYDFPKIYSAALISYIENLYSDEIELWRLFIQRSIDAINDPILLQLADEILKGRAKKME